MSGRDRDPSGKDDPFEGLVLDESFVRSARKVEASADTRSAAAARSRAAHAELEARVARDLALLEATSRGKTVRRRRGRRTVTVLALAIVVLSAGLFVWARDQAPSSEVATGDPSATATSVDPAEPVTPTSAGSTGAEPNAGGGPGAEADVITPRAHADNRPTPQRAASSVPLGTPAPLLGDGPHNFVEIGDDGSPAAYDPCRPIAVVVNSRTAPPDGDAIVDSALAEISRATGLQFVREGVSDEIPNDDRGPYLPDRFGDRWAPVLIAWTNDLEVPDLADDTVGIGGSTWTTIGDHSVFVSGTVALDGPELTLAEQDPDGVAGVRSVVLHELGHLVGLDHVDDATQLMYPRYSGVTELAAGDLAGLAELGTGACTDEL